MKRCECGQMIDDAACACRECRDAAETATTDTPGATATAPDLGAAFDRMAERMRVAEYLLRESYRLLRQIAAGDPLAREHAAGLAGKIDDQRLGV